MTERAEDTKSRRHAGRWETGHRETGVMEAGRWEKRHKGTGRQRDWRKGDGRQRGK